jgi:hypothetical protein
MILSEIFASPLLLILLAVVAFLYASVGHGGASGYLALMSLFAFPVTIMKPTALVLNILVSAISFYFFYREKKFEWKLFYPFAITSIPFSFLGGMITIETHYYKIILATVLVFAVARLLGFFRERKLGSKTAQYAISLIHWCSYWVFIRIDRYWRWDYFESGFVAFRLGQYEANSSRFGFVYFSQFGFGTFRFYF